MKKTIAAVATFATLFTGASAFASEGMSGQIPAFTPAKTCEERNARLDMRIEHKQAGQERLEARHEQFLERMEQLLADAQTAEVDTTELSDAMAELEDYREVITADYDGLMGTMLELQGEACNMTVDDWRAGMEEVKTYAQAHDEHGKEIRAFLTNTLRPAVMEVMGQVHPRE
jgi:DNA repair exonuclease SbcCD ATPase subunit